MTKNPAAVALGSIRSQKKADASKLNGKLGGRPKLYPPCISGRHRFYKGKCSKCALSQCKSPIHTACNSVLEAVMTKQLESLYTLLADAKSRGAKGSAAAIRARIKEIERYGY